MYRPVCVRPVQKPHCWFSNEAAQLSRLSSHAINVTEERYFYFFIFIYLFIFFFFVKVYQDAFNLIDKDGDGSISKDNLGAVMMAMGEEVDDQQLQDLINEVDADGMPFLVAAYSFAGD